METRKLCLNCEAFSNATLHCEYYDTRKACNQTCEHFQKKTIINWEQRRYEIAKDAMCAYMQSFDGKVNADECAKAGVMFANALISELKKH